jgi:hypothetical protein
MKAPRLCAGQPPVPARPRFPEDVCLSRNSARACPALAYVKLTDGFVARTSSSVVGPLAPCLKSNDLSYLENFRVQCPDCSGSSAAMTIWQATVCCRDHLDLTRGTQVGRQFARISTPTKLQCEGCREHVPTYSRFANPALPRSQSFPTPRPGLSFSVWRVRTERQWNQKDK